MPRAVAARGLSIFIKYTVVPEKLSVAVVSLGRANTSFRRLRASLQKAGQSSTHGFLRCVFVWQHRQCYFVYIYRVSFICTYHSSAFVHSIYSKIAASSVRRTHYKAVRVVVDYSRHKAAELTCTHYARFALSNSAFL